MRLRQGLLMLCFIPAILLFASSSGIAKVVSVNADLEGNVLKFSIQGPIHFKIGDTLSVKINGISRVHQISRWRFKFGGKSLSTFKRTNGTGTTVGCSIVITDDLPENAKLEFFDYSTPSLISIDSNNKPPDIVVDKTKIPAPKGQGVSQDAKSFKTVYKASANELVVFLDADGRLYSKNKNDLVKLPNEIDENDVIHVFVVGDISHISNMRVDIKGQITEDNFSIQSSAIISDIHNLTKIVGAPLARIIHK